MNEKDEKTVRIAPEKVMAVDAAGLRLAVYVNDKVLLSFSGDRWFGSPAGWRLFTIARCSDASERTTNSVAQALLIESFELPVTCDDARPSLEITPPRAIYTLVFERESDAAPVVVLCDCLAVPSTLGVHARLYEIVLANNRSQQ